jgi:hypothetical protein
MQHNQYTQVSDSQIVDPIIKLLEDVRLRKSKVTIPNEEDMIPSLYNDRTIRKSLNTEVIIGDNSPHFEKPIRFPNIFKNLRSPDFPTAQQKSILKGLARVPAYAVVNDNQEIVMAAPRGNQDANFFDWIYTKYYNLCVWKEDDGPISIALFFLNREDATLYLQEIGKTDPKTTEKTNLHVHLTNLDAFYKLNRTSSPGTQARLVADLEEIYRVVFDYIPKQLYPVHPKQKYSKNVYHGIPIYLMKSMIVKQDIKDRFPRDPSVFLEGNKVLETYGIITNRPTTRRYKRAVFFRLEDAHLAWKQFRSHTKTLRYPRMPNIEVYNLESYLLDLEDSDVDIVNDHYFIGTKSSLEELHQEIEIRPAVEVLNPAKDDYLLFLARKGEEFINKSAKKLVTFSKGMLWVFTSDTLPTEDNEW